MDIQRECETIERPNVAQHSNPGDFTSLQYKVPRSEIRKSTNITDIMEHILKTWTYSEEMRR